jgi:hypothetical protein
MLARTHARARIGGAAAYDGRGASKNDRACPPQRAPPAESGAYIVQVFDRGGVPRANVRVEPPGLKERLRAEAHAIDADGKHSHVSARICVRPKPHTKHTDAHLGASVV